MLEEVQAALRRAKRVLQITALNDPIFLGECDYRVSSSH